MGKNNEKLYRIPGCDHPFTESELRVIYRFFDCRSTDDLENAAIRYHTLFSSRKMESNVWLTDLELALQLASEVYVDFKSLDKPLERRNRISGFDDQKWPIELPDDILKKVEEERQKDQWGARKPTEVDLVRRLRMIRVLKADVAASRQVKAIQEERRRQSVDDFAADTPI